MEIKRDESQLEPGLDPARRQTFSFLVWVYYERKPHQPWLVFMRGLYPGRIGIWSVSFCGERKTGKPGEKPPDQGRGLTTNSTHI